ncbi:MAG: hypothetical protein JXQ71_07020 [Verrucomicrobia bacterium]|nr:hypothetical protein [Verrucomicrobiota bacterium]
MKKTKLLLCFGAMGMCASYVVYAACTPNATPGDRSQPYSGGCGCHAYSKYTTDQQGQTPASLATCQVCPASTGGCSSTCEHYTGVYEWSCPGGKLVSYTDPPSCLPVTAPPCASPPAHHSNVTKYEYRSTGCGT